MNNSDISKAGSGCSAASCSLSDSACDDKPKKVLTRFLVAKEIVTEDGQRHFESFGSTWLDHLGNVVENSVAWEAVSPFESPERIPEKWRLGDELMYIWSEGQQEWPATEGGYNHRIKLHQSDLCQELLEVLSV